MIHFNKNDGGSWVVNGLEAGVGWDQTKWEVISLIKTADGGLG